MDEYRALAFPLLCLFSGAYSGWFIAQKLARSEKFTFAKKLRDAEMLVSALADKELELSQANLQLAPWNSSASVKLHYEMCLGNWGNAKVCRARQPHCPSRTGSSLRGRSASE